MPATKGSIVPASYASVVPATKGSKQPDKLKFKKGFYMTKEKSRALLMLILSMVIFGTVGIFRRWIPLPSGLLSFSRGVIGAAVLCVPALITRKKSEPGVIKKNLPLLLVSGALIGVNWILLFEAYNHTTVSVATLCYYMAPVFIIAASPIVLREKLTLKKICCLLAAVFGMLLVSGVFGDTAGASLQGVLFGLGAAALYASVILINKKLTDVPAATRTVIQIGTAALAVLPYVLLTDGLDYSVLDGRGVALLLLMGAVHSGVAYLLYFGALPHLSAQTAAIFSYIDPVVALMLSAVLLHENMGLLGVIGAALILGAALISEIEIKFKKNKNNA